MNLYQARFKLMSKERVFVVLLSAALASIAGCGNGLSSVGGAVTLDGQAVTGADKFGTVAFYREAGGGAPAIGVLDQTGHYSLKTGSSDGVEPGTYKVAISIKKTNPPASRDALPIATPITPEKYASTKDSGLRGEVKPGSNTIDFALSSKGP
jgi:hypothetical protein